MNAVCRFAASLIVVGAFATVCILLLAQAPSTDWEEVSSTKDMLPTNDVLLTKDVLLTDRNGDCREENESQYGVESSVRANSKGTMGDAYNGGQQDAEEGVGATTEDGASYVPSYSPQQYSGSESFQSQGVIVYNGMRVMYYNPAALGTSAAALGNTTMGSPITYDVNGMGTYDGMVAVAMPSDYAYGTIVDTPFGQGIVVDHSGGAMDVVVDW